MNGKLEDTWKDVDVAYFKALARKGPALKKEKHEKESN
jgi:hypothetical protein